MQYNRDVFPRISKLIRDIFSRTKNFYKSIIKSRVESPEIFARSFVKLALRKLLSRHAKSMYREQGYSVNERVNIGTRACLHSKVADLKSNTCEFFTDESEASCPKKLSLANLFEKKSWNYREQFSLVFYFNLFLVRRKRTVNVYVDFANFSRLSHIFAPTHHFLLPI